MSGNLNVIFYNTKEKKISSSIDMSTRFQFIETWDKGTNEPTEREQESIVRLNTTAF